MKILKNPTNKQGDNAYSLSGQLLLWLMLCLFIILTVSAVFSYSRAYHFANLAYDRAILRVALALAEQVDVVNDQVVIDLPEIAKNLLEYDKDDFISYRISGPDGAIVVGKSNLKTPKLKVKSDDHVYYDDVLDGQKVRVVAYALPIINSKLKGDLLVQVAETRTKREFMVREIIEEMLIPQILIMLVTAWMIFFSIKRILQPLNEMKTAIAKRSHQDLSPVDTHHLPQEIIPLLNEINELMLRVKEGVDFQKAFIADASHQLRTPIAALQNQVELALREHAPMQTKHTLKNIEASAQHLSRLVHQLLTLARVEPNEKNNYPLEVLDLASLIQEVTANWVPLAIKNGIDLGFECEVSLSFKVSGNAFMLKEMLNNLIENAIGYTAHGGEITVALSHQSNKVVLEVIDNGIGIPPDRREQVFHRFYRVEDNVGDGCGLGLAIVNEIALAHQAEVYVKDGLPRVEENGQVAFGTNMTVQFEKG